ncbi:phage tail protein [uncultured Parasutterella sp.]|uniref:phage tail protein n=3 Tax=uncultured Parasutterella sp. TaxID=1263098 RepID=UPI0025B386C7|nr:phage tail protein [uncultured Parasutterella sp.]
MSNIQDYWTANSIQTPPDLSQLSSKGYPTNGDPARGIPPTLPGAGWFHRVSQLFASVINAAGLTIDPADTDQLLKALKVFSKKTVPIGVVVHYMGDTIPEGYLLCNGASLSRTEYPELFAVLGTKCGAADTAHFNIPDTHHRFLEGTTVLSEIGKYIAEGLPNIEGAFLAFLKISGVFTTQGTNVYAAINTEGHSLADIFFNARNASSVYGGSNTVQPSSMRALSLIRAF